MDPKPNSKLASAVLGLFATALILSATGFAQSAAAQNQAGGESWGTACDSKPHANDIDVGAKVGCKLAFASRSDKTHILRWRSEDPKMNVKIDFSWPNPFQHMTDCDGTKRMCRADTPGAPGDQAKRYPYTASLCDQQGACTVVTDPGIIIVP
jgi:hypothetical protein